MLYERTLSILEKLIAFDTTSRNSNLPLIDYVAAYLKGYGIASHMDVNKEGTKANLFASLGPKLPGGIVFSGHTDVVPVDGQDWHTPPFTLTFKDGKWYGRGTADMKSFLAVVLALVPEWCKGSLAMPVHLAFTYDEEVGCLGVHSLIHYMKSLQLMPDLVVVGEPTSMQVVEGHKGLYSYKTTVRGLEAHSSQVHKGVNAIVMAARLIGFLEQLQEEYRQKEMAGAKQFDPPYTSFQVGMIKGGTALNIIPKECWFEWEYRIIPGEDGEAIFKQFQHKAEVLVKEMRLRYPHADIVTEPLSLVPFLKGEGPSALKTKLLYLTKSNKGDTVSFVTEAGIFQHHQFPALICGPGSIDQAHKPNEYVTEEQLRLALQIFSQLVTNN